MTVIDFLTREQLFFYLVLLLPFKLKDKLVSHKLFDSILLLRRLYWKNIGTSVHLVAVSRNFFSVHKSAHSSFVSSSSVPKDSLINHQTNISSHTISFHMSTLLTFDHTLTYIHIMNSLKSIQHPNNKHCFLHIRLSTGGLNENQRMPQSSSCAAL